MIHIEHYGAIGSLMLISVALFASWSGVLVGGATTQPAGEEGLKTVMEGWRDILQGFKRRLSEGGDYSREWLEPNMADHYGKLPS